MLNHRDSLLNIKTKLVSDIIPRYENLFNKYEKEEIYYILCVLNQCIFDPCNLEKIECLFIEISSFYEMNEIKQPHRRAVRIRLNNILRQIRGIIYP